MGSQLLQNAQIIKQTDVLLWKIWRKYESVSYLFSCTVQIYILWPPGRPSLHRSRIVVEGVMKCVSPFWPCYDGSFETKLFSITYQDPPFNPTMVVEFYSTLLGSYIGDSKPKEVLFIGDHKCLYKFLVQNLLLGSRKIYLASSIVVWPSMTPNLILHISIGQDTWSKNLKLKVRQNR